MVSNIWIAAADNQVRIVESYLDSNNFTPNSKDQNGYTPIHAAASYGHTGLLKMLINRGGNINIQDNEGDTPLHHVEDLKTAKMMVEELNADFKIRNHEGMTAADYLEEDGEFPELIFYLKSLLHEGVQDASSEPDFLSSLPSPGVVDGHNIRYTMEKDLMNETNEEDEERRKKLEAIINSENPEESLRDLIKDAVHEGLTKYREEGKDGNHDLSSKRQK